MSEESSQKQQNHQGLYQLINLKRVLREGIVVLVVVIFVVVAVIVVIIVVAMLVVLLLFTRKSSRMSTRVQV